MFSQIIRKIIFARQERMLMKNQKVPFVLDAKDAESSSQNERLTTPKEITSKYY